MTPPHLAEQTTYVRLRIPGFHNWPDAPFHRTYLRERHRHLFWVEVAVGTHDPDREVEFHDLQDTVRFQFARWLDNAACEFGAMSCEMIALEIAKSVADLYGLQTYVDVSEDGEAGGRVVLHPDPDAIRGSVEG